MITKKRNKNNRKKSIQGTVCKVYDHNSKPLLLYHYVGDFNESESD